jgi:hypothetical protein
MSFGKYTLYSCYDTTANCNTYPVAFGILFGNEDKEGWIEFWDIVKCIHPSIDDTRATIITDQAKELTHLIAEVLPLTGHFHCSCHIHQNILIFVRGGTQTYSCLWLYNKLVKANTQCEIEHLKHKHAPFMNEKALKYLNAVNDAAQYPWARIDVDFGRFIMNQRTASLAVDSMNQANKVARDRTAVDVVCATKLLLTMSSKRYHEKKEMAWKWQGQLSPYGEMLHDAAFKIIIFQHNSINITEGESTGECRVTRNGQGHKERMCFFIKKTYEGSVFGGCSCGIPYTDGAPCHHMVAVVKLSRIESLTATNSMPVWWSTECWCNQYPADTNETFHFDMDTLRLHRKMQQCGTACHMLHPEKQDTQKITSA